MDYKISVVVPVYNVAPYIRECLDSIIAQTIKEIEILVIDDGSTDGSSIICDEYGEKYKCVKVIHQTNQGLTVTRRAGVNAALGEYVGFVDGDDWIDSDMYEELLRVADDEGVDIVTSGIIREFEDVSNKPILQDSLEKGKYFVSDVDFLQSIWLNYSSDRWLNGSLCNKVFKNKIIKEVLNSVPNNVNGCMDDTVCVAGTVLASKSVYITKICKYHHRERKDSYSHAINKNIFEQISHAYNALDSIVKNSDYYSLLYPKLIELIFINIFDGFKHGFDYSAEFLPKYFVRIDDQVELGANIILYGYGEVGKSLYRQLIAEKKYNVIAVADKKAEEIIDLENCIMPEAIDRIEADYVLIGVKSKESAEKITQELKNLGVKKMMIWKKPIFIMDYYKI